MGDKNPKHPLKKKKVKAKVNVAIHDSAETEEVVSKHHKKHNTYD